MEYDDLCIRFHRRSPLVAIVKALRWTAPTTTAVTAVVLFGAAVVVNARNGTLGTFQEWNLFGDFGRVVSSVILARSPEPSPPSFPFIRDYPSILLIVAIAVSFGVLQRQWRLFSTCLADLHRNGVLVPRLRVDASKVSAFGRLLAWTAFGSLAKDDGRAPIAVVVERTNERLASRFVPVPIAGTRFGFPLAAAAAAVLAVVIVIGERLERVFHVLAPGGPASDTYERWLDAAYANWWASSHHVHGLVFYLLVATFGLYVVILQNLGGFYAVALVVVLPMVAEFEVDWTNADGHFGWKPLTDAYRTVMASLLVHAMAISMLIFVLGLGGAVWLVALILLWGGGFLLYTVLPYRTFSSLFPEAAKKRRGEIEIAFPIMGGTLADRIRCEEELRVRLERINGSSFHPLYARRLDPQLLLASFTVPVVLTFVQVVAAA